MKKTLTVIFSLFLLMISFALSSAAEQDIKNGKDHLLLSHMPDFRLSDYKELEFGSYKFIGQDKKQVSIEGHKYYLEYKLQKGIPEPGELKIRRNIQDALKKIGGKVVFDDNFNRVSTILLKKGAKETWVEVRSFNAMYRLNIIERETMKQEVVADAAAMGNDINSTGHVAIYGIYFDTGKADLKLESDAALAEISTMLKNNGTLKLYVVGHTDNQGSFNLNMRLSKERAEAVVKALSGKYRIQISRLKPFGVASLVPVASNDSEEGRAKNRRVELVKQ
jgi:outer membrane protein OmpA-like peptidoglycan-associated protein